MRLLRLKSGLEEAARSGEQHQHSVGVYLDEEPWQTFGRLRFESNQAMQRKRDFSSPLSMFFGDKNDYAL